MKTSNILNILITAYAVYFRLKLLQMPVSIELSKEKLRKYICPLLGNYAAQSGIFLPRVCDNLSVHFKGSGSPMRIVRTSSYNCRNERIIGYKWLSELFSITFGLLHSRSKQITKVTFFWFVMPYSSIDQTTRHCLPPYRKFTVNTIRVLHLPK